MQAAKTGNLIKRIALVFPHHRIFERVEYGLSRYALARRDWLFSVGENAPQYLGRLNFAALVGMFGDSTLRRRYHNLGLPMIAALGCPPPEGLMPFIEVDHEAVAKQAAEYLLALGFRHFGFVGYADAPDLTHHRLRRAAPGFQGRRCRAFRAALGELAESFSVAPHYHPIQTSWREPLIRWLRALPTPTAVLAVDDTVGRFVIELCRFHGLAVPDRISVLGINDDEQTCTLARPPLSSVAIPWEQIGEEIGRLLDELFERGELTPRIIRVAPTGVVARGSTAPVTADELVGRILATLRARSHVPGKIKGFLEGFGLSRRQLERRFRQATGRSLMDHLRRLRVEHALEMLRDTKLSDHEIARASGFSSAAHLRRVIRQFTGRTTGHWRQHAPR